MDISPDQQVARIAVLAAIAGAAVVWLVFSAIFRRRSVAAERAAAAERDAARDAYERGKAAALVGQSHHLEQAIRGGRGQIRIAGSLWQVAGPDLEAGRRVTVTGIDGTTLLVVPDKPNLPKAGSFFG